MRIALLTSTLLALTGCSTIINGTHQTITITSLNYNNSNIQIESSSNKSIKALPAKLDIYPSNEKPPLTITSIGNCIKPDKVILRKQLADHYWLNIFNGVGFFVDYATGAMWQYPASAEIHTYRKDHCTEIPYSLSNN